MSRLGIARGRGIGAMLLAVAALCPGARGDDTPAAASGAWIGVTTRAVTHAWPGSSHYGANGVAVVDVAPGSPANQAGIVAGDIVVSIDGRALKMPDDLLAAERALEPGRAVEVVLARGGGRMIMTFGLRPAPLAGQSAPAAGARASSGASIDGAGAAGAAVGAGASAPAEVAAGGAGAAAATGATVGAGAAEASGTAGAAADGAGAAAATGAAVGIAAAAGASSSSAGPEPTPFAGSTGTPIGELVPVPVPATAAAVAPPDTAQAPIADVRSKGAAGLGVRCENLSLDLAAAVGSKPGQGVLVLGVTTASPADRAGIRPGDVISRVGGEPVVDVDGLDRLLASATSPLPIVAMRRGTTREVTAEFPAPPPAASTKAGGPEATDQLLSSLRDEVRGLREEIRKFREELANRASGTDSPHP